MAAKKKKGKKRRRSLHSGRAVRFRRLRQNPVWRKWYRWSHDLDTILHELVKNPALADVDPKDIIARAEAFADAYCEMQTRRRPRGIPDDL